MLIYMGAIASILLLDLILQPKRSKNRKTIFLMLSFALLFLISGLRGYTVGADTADYVRIYQIIGKLDLSSSRLEPGFLWFLRLLSRISADPGFMLMVTSLIGVGSVFLFIGRFSEEPLISVLLYVLLRAYISSMNTMRESLAASIALFSFMLVLQKRTTGRVVLAVLLILATSLIHASVIVLLLPLVLWGIHLIRGDCRNPLPWRSAGMILLIAAGCFVLYSGVMFFVNVAFPRYANYFTGRWSDANYSASLMKMLISLVFLLVGTVFFDRERDLDETDRLAYIMLGCAVVSGALSIRMEIWGRITGYFTLYTPLLWAPRFLARVQGAKEKLFIKMAIIVFSWLYLVVVLVLRPEWDGVVPYAFR